MRELIVVLWRAGLRIREALMLAETDLDERRSSVMVRHSTSTRTSRRRGSGPGTSSPGLEDLGPAVAFEHDCAHRVTVRVEPACDRVAAIGRTLLRRHCTDYGLVPARSTSGAGASRT